MFITHYFYTLSYVDASGDTQIFYVGRTVDQQTRLRDHIRRASKKNSVKDKFLVQLISEGIPVQLTPVSCVRVPKLSSESDVRAIVAPAEDELIEQYQKWVPNLTNTAKGNCGSIKGSLDRLVWTDEMLSVIGTITDIDFERRFGVSNTSVYNKRKELNIPPLQVCNRIQWDDYDHLLGTVSDTELAAMTGIDRSLVSRRRRKLNIPAFVPDNAIDWSIVYPLLGKMTDSAVTKLTGVNTKMVTKKRNQLGIPAFTKLK